MKFVETFDLWPFLDSVVSLSFAFLFGTAVGAERQYRQRTAGLRTNALVAVGAAAFVDLSMRITGPSDATRVIANVVSGIGFLGAGAIMKEGLNVRGLNTAATIWCAGAIGACTGSDMIAEAALLTVFVIVGNTLLRPLANFIDRVPINELTTEATYEVSVMTDEAALPDVREAMVEELKRAHYPAGDITVEKRKADTVEVIAQLVSTAVDPDEMNGVIDKLERIPGVTHAAWELSTVDGG